MQIFINQALHESRSALSFDKHLIRWVLVIGPHSCSEDQSEVNLFLNLDRYILDL